MTETLTRRQQVAVEALEAARQAGMTLSDYAKAHGVEVRPVYDAIAALRHEGDHAGGVGEHPVPFSHCPNAFVRRQKSERGDGAAGSDG